jgi:RimJ/RimL family protein N-acetyltransferase
MTELNITFERCDPIMEHARQVMNWRNDPTSLSMFYHSEPKRWETFWPEFQDTYFQDLNCPPPVFVLVDGNRVGFLRFQRLDHLHDIDGVTVDISINIAPEERGKGLASHVLRATLDHLAAQHINNVYAEVRAENIASKKAFIAAQFTEIGEKLKHIADTGETCKIIQFIAKLTITR